MFGVLFFSLLNAQHKQTLTPPNEGEGTTPNSYDNAKKKPNEFWKLEGNKNIDSTKHFLGTKDFNPLIIKTNATERMRITSSGNIGIGTAVPNYPLEVQVPAFVKTLSADYVHISKGLTVGDLHFCRGNNCSIDTVHTTQQRDLLLRSNNLLGLIADTVKVASSVTNTTRFQIDGSVVTRDLYLNSSGIQQGDLLMLGSNNKVIGVNILPPPIEPNPSCTKIVTLPWRLYGDTLTGQMFDSVSIVKYPLEGYVGIGTCYPSSKLTVYNIDQYPISFFVGSPHPNAGFTILRDGKVGIGITPQANLDIYQKNVSASHNFFRISDNSITHFVVTNQGVGVGTGTPQATLEVAGNGSQAAFLVKYGNSTELVVTDQGVGIGTMPDPQYSMNVCGSIHAQEVVVDPPGWCDYVFENDYELMPWDSLMNFVRTHKHLPGVPSEAEVSQTGISVGAMHQILLKKIEELVLYNEELRKKVQTLEEKIESLEATNLK